MYYHPFPKSMNKPLVNSETASSERFLYKNPNSCNQSESWDILDLFDPFGLKAAVCLLPHFLYVEYIMRKHITIDLYLFSHE